MVGFESAGCLGGGHRVGVALRFVHVLRNPYDNLATIHRRRLRHGLDAAIAHYFAMVRGVEALWREVPAGERIHAELDRHPFLRGYRFES